MGLDGLDEGGTGGIQLVGLHAAVAVRIELGSAVEIGSSECERDAHGGAIHRDLRIAGGKIVGGERNRSRQESQKRQEKSPLPHASS